MKEKITCTKMELYFEKDRAYIYAEYLKENDKEVRKCVLPKITLPIRSDRVPDIRSDRVPDIRCGPLYLSRHTQGVAMEYYIPTDNNGLVLGNGSVDFTDSKSGYFEKIIETKTREMTLTEIEAKLGHKVKIINEEKNGGSK